MGDGFSFFDPDSDDRLLYEFAANNGFTRGTISVYGDRYTFTSKKGVSVYEFSNITSSRKDKLGNMEIKFTTGTPLYYSVASKEGIESFNKTIEFIRQHINPEIAEKPIQKSSLTIGDRIGFGNASRSENDSEFVKRVMNLPGADTWGTKKEIIDLERLMQGDEDVKAISSGYYENRTWLFACTDRRILAVNKNFMIGGDQVEIPFRQINGITLNTGLVMSTVTIQTGFKHMKIEKILKESAKRFVDVAHEQMEAYENKANAPAQVVQQVSPSSDADELRKFKSLLDDGIITQEEFDAKKKQLLGL